MVSTMIDGVPTMAGWVIYMTGTATMGAFGGFGGFAFWLVWRTMRPNKALQGTHDEAARP